MPTDAAQTEASPKEAKLARDTSKLMDAPKSQARPKGNPDTLDVGCKVPNGLLIHMRSRDGEVVQVKLNGSGAPVVPTVHRPVPEHMIVSGYGITTVDKEMFEAWLEDHRSYTPVAKGLVFVEKSRERAVAHAKEAAAEKSGLEPLSPPKANPGEKANVISPRDAV